LRVVPHTFFRIFLEKIYKIKIYKLFYYIIPALKGEAFFFKCKRVYLFQKVCIFMELEDVLRGFQSIRLCKGERE